MLSLKTWVMASRPKTLPAAVAPVLIGSAMAYADDAFAPWAATAALFGALFIQIGTNFANDYFDYIKGCDTEGRLGPTRVTQAGLISLRGMRWGTVGAFLMAALVGLYLVYCGGWPIVVIGLLAIVSGILYTAGPFPLGYIGLGDIVVLIFFGFVAVGGTYYVQTGTMKARVLLAGAGPGLLATAILAVNNLRDRETDLITGKRTLAVRFGARFAQYEYLGCIVLAACVPIVLCSITRDHYAALVSIPVLRLALPAIRTVMSGEGGAELNHVLGATGRVLLLYSAVFAVGWVL